MASLRKVIKTKFVSYHFEYDMILLTLVVFNLVTTASPAGLFCYRIILVIFDVVFTIFTKVKLR